MLKRIQGGLRLLGYQTRHHLAMPHDSHLPTRLYFSQQGRKMRLGLNDRYTFHDSPKNDHMTIIVRACAGLKPR